MNNFNYDMVFNNPEILINEISALKNQGWNIYEYSVKISKKSDLFDSVKKIFPLDPPIEGNSSWQALSDSIGGGLEKFRNDGVVILIKWDIEAGVKASQEVEEFIDILFDIKNDQFLEKMKIFSCYFQ